MTESQDRQFQELRELVVHQAALLANHEERLLLFAQLCAELSTQVSHVERVRQNVVKLAKATAKFADDYYGQRENQHRQDPLWDLGIEEPK